MSVDNEDAHLSVETVRGVLSGPGPMRSRLCPVAANRHAAPTSCVGLAYVHEPKSAGRAFALADKGEIFLADKVAHSFCDREQ